LIRVLQSLRDTTGYPISISYRGGCRCEVVNEMAGGVGDSQHLLGKAADIKVAGLTPKRVQEILKTTYPYKYGIGSYETFTHIDSRANKARW